MQQMLLAFIKWPNFQKSVSKFMPKLFHEIDTSTRCRFHKTFFSITYTPSRITAVKTLGNMLIVA